MAPSGSRSLGGFVLVGLAIALLIGVVASNFAANTPDALQRAIIDSACEDASNEEACLAEQEGQPALEIAPDALLGYEVSWLSGLVGIVLTFAVGAGLVLLLRRSGGSGSSAGTAGRRAD